MKDPGRIRPKAVLRVNRVFNGMFEAFERFFSCRKVETLWVES